METKHSRNKILTIDIQLSANTCRFSQIKNYTRLLEDFIQNENIFFGYYCFHGDIIQRGIGTIFKFHIFFL